jgi:hypothetical protein
MPIAARPAKGSELPRSLAATLACPKRKQRAAKAEPAVASKRLWGATRRAFHASSSQHCGLSTRAWHGETCCPHPARAARAMVLLAVRLWAARLTVASLRLVVGDDLSSVPAAVGRPVSVELPSNRQVAHPARTARAACRRRAAGALLVWRAGASRFLAAAAAGGRRGAVAGRHGRVRRSRRWPPAKAPGGAP